jgi:hypothetical protein
MWTAVFDAFKRLVIFILGVCIIIEGLYDDGVPVKSIILGMIMVGVLPLEDLLPWSRKQQEAKAATQVQIIETENSLPAKQER